MQKISGTFEEIEMLEARARLLDFIDAAVKGEEVLLVF